jgi:hypothetical protein
MPSANCSSDARHVWWKRLSTLLSFVLALGWAGSAFAAAPMCGVHAQTVAAPPIGTPGNTDSLAENPCSESAPLSAAGVPNREAPEKLSLPELQIRALPALPWLAPAPPGVLLSAAAPEHEIRATGFARSIYRPPRG